MLPSPGTHVPTRTHTHVSSEIAPADLKIPAGDSEGERRTVVEALWAGRGAYLEAGAEGGGKCGYLPPHILNPAASPCLPYTAPGTPSQAMEGREVTAEGDHPPQTKGWGALGPTLESGRVCLVLVLAASLIKLASGRMVSGGEGGGSPLTLHLGSQTCQAGCSLFLQQRRGMGKGNPGSRPGVIKRPRKARTFP